jgi:hypothetical protein
MTSAPPLEVHAMIEALAGNRELQARLRENAAALFDQFSIPAAHRGPMLEGTSDAMHRIGVHPSMQFKYLNATGRPPVKVGSVLHYLDRR